VLAFSHLRKRLRSEGVVMKIDAIARKLGISPTTVSRSLSGRGRVSVETRQKVLKEAKKLGYVPNYHAQRLATGRSGVILLHATDVDADFMLEMMRGIWGALHTRGYGLVLDAAGVLGEGYAVLDEWARARAVDGAIIISGAPIPKSLHGLEDANIPLVTAGYSWAPQLPYAGSVTWNLQPGAAEVAETLIELGHRRIGFINIEGPDVLLDYFREALLSHGVTLPEDAVVVAHESSSEAGSKAFRELLTRPHPPTAIFARNDILALGAILEAQAHGLRIPQDLSIIGHDDLPFVQYCTPTLTTVHVDCAKVGEAAAEMLSDLIDQPTKPSRTPPTQVVECLSLVIRESTGPVKKAKRKHS
jgi:DNA-binding LacI/PurR family transcriptional regulator